MYICQCYSLSSFLRGSLDSPPFTIPRGPFFLNFPLALTQTCSHQSPSCLSLPGLLPGPQDKGEGRASQMLAIWSCHSSPYHLVMPSFPGPCHFLVYIFPFSLLAPSMTSTFTSIICSVPWPPSSVPSSTLVTSVPQYGGHSWTTFHGLPPSKTSSVVQSLKPEPPRLPTSPLPPEPSLYPHWVFSFLNPL